MRMKTLLMGLLLGSLTMSASYDPVQYGSRYSVEIDIADRSDDRATVSVIPPVQYTDTVVYAMPKIVPGTYDISDFGQFVKSLKATDSRGNELEVERLDVNRWAIYPGKSLYKITYEVDDSQGDSKARIFLPGGTAIEPGGALINAFGYVGFVVGQEEVEFHLEVAHEPGLHGISALDFDSNTEKRHVYTAANYFELHDRPLIFTPTESASVFVAGAEITVGVFSPDGNLNADSLLQGVKPVFDAAATYLGGQLPTDQYVVLVWGVGMQQLMQESGMGALEHFTSTVVTMPDVSDRVFGSLTGGGERNPKLAFLRDVVAHEFFHIVTPLNIHSEHIHDYDFINPQMSAHLWFYEGLTEYNSVISQVRAGLISETEFLATVREKLLSADNFDEHLPMTLRSVHALDFFAGQYLDVYQKGAIIGMGLDLQLRGQSSGDMGLVDLMNQLMEAYGPDTFFVDDRFFGIIGEMTSEDTEEFLLRHVAGTEPLPLKELMGAAGYSYRESEKEYVLANPDWNTVYTSARGDHYFISRFNEEDDFMAGFGLQVNDQLVRWAGEKVKPGKLDEVLSEWRETACIGQPVTIEVIRTDESGNSEELELTSVTTFDVNETRHQLSPVDNPTEEQLALRKAWLNL